MLKNYFINISLILVLLFNISYAQTDNFYKKAWNTLDSLENMRRSQSVYNQADNIYKQAKTDKNYIERIRALSVKVEYARFNKEGESAFIISLEEEIHSMPSQYTALMHSCIANAYLLYYTKNRYKINKIQVGSYNNPNLGFNTEHSKVKPVKYAKNIPMERWDKDDFRNIIDYHFAQSLVYGKSYNKLKQEDYSRILYSSDNKKRDKSLYELLVYNAIDFYFSNNRFSDYNVIIENPDFFKPAEYFVKIDIKQYEEDTFKYRGLQALQKLTDYIFKTHSKEALVRTELYRYNIIKSKYQGKNKFLHYTDALKYLEKNYKNKEVANVMYEHAKELFNNSDKVMGYKKEEKEYYHKKNALKLCNDCINIYEASQAVKLCKKLKKKILAKTISVNSESIIPSKKVFPIFVNYLNTETLWIRVWKPALDITSERNFGRNDKKLLKGAKLISTQKFLVKGGNDYNRHSTELLLKGLEVGNYVLEVSAEEKLSSDKFSMISINVSDIQYMHRVINSKMELKVVDRSSGKTLSGVGMKYYKREWSKGKLLYTYLGEKVSDNNGMIYFDKSQGRVFYKLFKGKDTLNMGYKYIHHSYGKNKERTEIKIFTDRKIYRPGEKIHFKTIVYSGKDNNYKVKANEVVNIEIRDASNQKIGEKKLTTNEYGSLSGSFDLPYNMLTGNCVIRTFFDKNVSEVKSGNYHLVRVEEYKSPKFEVKIKKTDKEYKFKDEIKVEAEATSFNGVYVSDAKFEYKIYREKYDIWKPWCRNSEKILIHTGKGITDKEGKINFSFIAKPLKNILKSSAVSYNVEISVTDINGETQNISNYIKVSSQSLFINSNLEKIISTNELEKGILFKSKNINGSDIPAEINIEFIKLKSPEIAVADRLWEKPTCPVYNIEEWKNLYPTHVYIDENKIENYKQIETIANYTINTNENDRLIIPKRELPEAGVYLLKAVSKDRDGKEVVYTKFFTLYNIESKVNPDKQMLWSACTHTKAYPGDIIKYTFGSSSNIEAQYELYVNGKSVITEKILLNNEQKTINIPIEERYRGNILLKISTFKDNREYTETKQIDIPFNNKGLDMHIASFRDKLLPGEKERWTVTVKDWKNKIVDAEILASLYDASLDKLAKNDWYMYIYRNYNNIKGWVFDYQPLTFGTFKGFKKEEFELDIFEEDLDNEILFCIAPPAPPNVVDEFNIVDDEAEVALGEEVVKVRDNFEHTAFFYPFLRTNEKGELEISFTVPESLTKWKLLALAHTKELSIGTVTKYLETKKELMVNTNAPRFFREGDKVVFTTKLSNISDKNLKGKIRLKLQDAITGEFLEISESDMVKVFNVASKENSIISWTLNIPANLSLLKYTIIATDGNYSDAESSLVPVLSKRIMATKSMPFSVTKIGENTITAPNFRNILKKKTVEPYKMTMEFASNPMWYAVQSLPYLMETPNEASEQIFSRYFANKLASYIVNSNPKIKDIYQVWKAGASKESFLSKLEKNKELKNIILQETPWVAEAKSEEERMMRLGMLFDLNNISVEENRSLKKLKESQNNDGGWPWFKEMKSSRFITQHILAGFGYLNKITGNEISNIKINSALRWCSKEFIKSYNKLMESNNLDKELSFTNLHYLYMTSFFKNVKYTQEEEEVVKFYLNKCIEYWKDASLYNKGLAALVLYRNGYEQEAKNIVASLKEYAINDSDNGMYWKENIGSMYAHKAQIETHSLMIEVFSEITKDKQAVDDMKIWLLNNKRTNSWNSSKATVCAIYALISNKNDNFDMDSKLKVYAGNKQVFDAAKIDNISEAGAGYIKKVYGKEEILKSMDKISVSKSTDNLMWGALYLQYFEDIDKVMASLTGLKIEKQIFVERTVDGKLKLELVEEGTLLYIGDKLKVVLSVFNNFPMEYVHIKDLRASSLEPGFVKSGYRYKNGLGYYISLKDTSVNFFIDYLPMGRSNFSYNLIVSHKGKFSNGISTIQCMYAPEYQANSKGEVIEIK